MQQKVYICDQKVTATCCDMTGHWKPGSILETMQEAAGTHAELLGIGRSSLIRQDLVWIVTRSEVVMDRYPVMGQTITVETFPAPVRRWFFPRYFIFRDAQGKQIGYSGTLWALMNINSRKMENPEGVRRFLPDNSDLITPMGLPSAVNEVSGTLEISDFYPVYTDLDVNGHVNNSRYIDWCCNRLGIDTMRECCLKRFAINYDSEILPGRQVRTELRRFADDFSFCGFAEGHRSFDVGGTLSARED